MAELLARDAKLIQYLNEAYGKEKELETALQAHIALTTRDTYKKRLKDHLKETKAQSTGLKKRIKELGGKAEVASAPGPDVVADAAGAVQSVANKALAAAQGPLHGLRGTSESEKMLKNAKSEYSDEAEEIANYRAIETLADAVGDRDTAKLAKEYRRQEERMASFLEKTIDQLTKEVVKEEVPSDQRGKRRPATSRRKSSATKSSSTKRPSAKSSASKATSAASKTSASRRSSSKSSASPAKRAASSRSRARKN